VSRAPSPAGVAPCSRTALQNDDAASTGTAHSTPSSPVYPVPAAVHVAPRHSKCVTWKRPTEAACGQKVERIPRDLGPWTATTARWSVVSVPPTASRTRDVLDAFGMTSKISSPVHHTITSSSTEPSESSRRWEYWARPGPTLRRSLESERCSRSNAPRPSTRTVPRWLTSKATADARHALCSAKVPDGYARGIDQPPNSTNLAPRETCSSSRGECLRAAGSTKARPYAPGAPPIGADSSGVVTIAAYAAGEAGRAVPCLATSAR
jgi:hypothetical protein